MIETVSFGANGCIESCRCDQEFWIYPKQNKGRITTLIINQTKMTKIRDLFEKIWWVIPPIVVVLGIPLYFTVEEMLYFSLPFSFNLFAKNILNASYYFLGFKSYWGLIITLSTIASMVIGYFLSMKRPLSIRIVVPVITAIIGFLVSTVIVFFLTVY
jgi:hypothetical protein